MLRARDDAHELHVQQLRLLLAFILLISGLFLPLRASQASSRFSAKFER
jgi:hypothetical protein